MGGAGRRLPLPWAAVNDLVTLRTNELVMLAGAPGGGKSTLSVNLAMDLKVPVLYFAQDSPNSILSRMTAVGSETDTKKTAEWMATDLERIGLADRLEGVRPTLLINRGAITFEQFEQKAFAFREWLGVYPPVIIIDNLIDMIVEGSHPSEAAFYATVLPRLKQFANKNNCTIICLHHVKRSDEKGTGTAGINMNDLLFAGEREARHVWGVYRSPQNDRLFLQILKQQDGVADAMGGLAVPLRWYPAMGRLASQ